MAKNNVRQVSIFINGNEVVNSIKSIAAEQKKLTNELVNTVRGTEEYERKASELTRVNAILREHNDRVRGIEKGWSLTKIGLDKFIGVAAGAFAVDNLIGYGKELFNTAVKMEALEKKAKIVFGSTLPQVNEEAKKNAEAMGFTTSQYVAAAAAIQDILVPMGFQRQEAARISTQLTNLSGALSEWTGGQITATQVSEILASALTGEREQLKQLGIVLQQSDIDARLAEKGLSGLTGEIRQQAEAAVSLELILEKSQDAQTAYAENADSMTRKTAELTARFEDIKEVVATALIPVFEGLLDIVSDVSDAIGDFKDPITNIPIAEIIKSAKSEQEKGFEDVKKLKAEADALLSKYGITQEKQGEFDPKAAAEEARRKKAAEESAKKRKQEAEKLAKDLEDLIKRTTAARLDLVSKAQDDELAVTIRGIEKRYDAEIAKSLELEKKGVQEATAQRIALEKLKQEEIGLAVEADISKAVEAASKQAKEEAEARIKARKEVEDRDIEERAAALNEIKAFAQENLLTEQEQELLQLEEHYNNLLELAKTYGADTTSITAAYEAAKAKAVKDSTEQRLQYEKDLADAQAELELVKADAFVQSTAILGGFFEETSALGKALFLFEKAAAAVSIILSLQKEKAAIFAAARLGTIFDPTGLAAAALAAPQIIAANIRAGISLGAIAATAIKGIVKQKAAGGFLSVTGADDGRTYNASVIPTPYTGLLPNHPVLFQSRATGAPVLASERGAEYFVSSESLRNPYVANLTRMIDNIAGGRSVAQFAEGGANPPATATTATTVDMSVIERNTAVMEALLSAIGRGIVAVIPDRTLTDIPERLGKINNASGGFFG